MDIMVKYIKTASAIIIAMLAAGCAKEIAPIEPERGTIDVSIDGIINGYSEQEDSKASAQNVVRIMWAGGEMVYAYEGTKYLGELSASIDDTDGTYARLSGTITAPEAGKTVTLVYSPQFISAPAVTGGVISLDLARQDQSEVPFLIYGILPVTSSPTISNTAVRFALATSVYKCNCAGLPKGALTEASVGAVNTKCELSLSDSAAPAVGGSTPGRIKRTAGFTTADADQRAIFSIALAKTNAGGNRTIEVDKGGSAYEAAFAKTAFDPAKAYNAVFVLKGKITPPPETIPGKFTVDEDGKQVLFSRGNLIYNVGSARWSFYEHQYDCATGYDPNIISLFTWGYGNWSTVPDTDNYKRGEFVDWGITIGDIWWTLSLQEWYYLLYVRPDAALKYGYATVNNVHGLILLPDEFTDPEVQGDKGNAAFVPCPTTNWNANIYSAENWEAMQDAGAVFLPAAGMREKDQVKNVGAYGYYWSSSPNVLGYNALLIKFLSDYVGLDDVNRFEGCSVRVVATLAPARKYTVHFNTNGKGEAPADITGLKYGSTIAVPIVPLVESSLIAGWYKEPSCINAWDFDKDIVTRDFTLYAKWKDVPYGGIGRFTVNSIGGQVCFSTGNLWYGKDGFHIESDQWEAPTGQFMDEDHVAHFCWNKDAMIACAKEYSGQICEPGVVLFTNETKTTAKQDFTVDNNGQKDTGIWRTLSGGKEDCEWNYLFNKRVVNNGTGAGHTYTNCSSGVNIGEKNYRGLFIYPDNYTGAEIGNGGPDSWDEIDNAGIVFLPLGGCRGNGMPIINTGTGYYWSSSQGNNYAPTALRFSSTEFETYTVEPESNGQFIRLVSDGTS